MVYRITIIAPYVAEAATLQASPLSAENITQSTSAATARAPPTIWDTILNISSPLV